MRNQGKSKFKKYLLRIRGILGEREKGRKLKNGNFNIINKKKKKGFFEIFKYLYLGPINVEYADRLKRLQIR